MSNLFARLKKYIDWEESREDLILDHRLTKLFCELREWEHKFGTRLPRDFDSRVMAKLESEEVRNISLPTWVISFLENKRLQYGISFAMAGLLAAVIFTRLNHLSQNEIPDTAGVVLENTEYLNQPSSAEYADSYYRRVFVQSVKDKEGALETLLNLENYFLATGKKGVANEIRYFIEEVNR